MHKKELIKQSWGLHKGAEGDYPESLWSRAKDKASPRRSTNTHLQPCVHSLLPHVHSQASAFSLIPPSHGADSHSSIRSVHLEEEGWIEGMKEAENEEWRRGLQRGMEGSHAYRTVNSLIQAWPKKKPYSQQRAQIYTDPHWGPSGPVVFDFFKVGLATSQTASQTSHALTAWTLVWLFLMSTLCSPWQLWALAYVLWPGRVHN